MQLDETFVNIGGRPDVVKIFFGPASVLLLFQGAVVELPVQLQLGHVVKLVLALHHLVIMAVFAALEFHVN